MAWPLDEEAPDDSDPVAALLRALREDAVQEALDAIEADTGLPRERVIAEAVVFTGAERRAFLSHLRRRPSGQRDAGAQPPRKRRLLVENGVEILVGGMFLLGALLAAIQIVLNP